MAWRFHGRASVDSDNPSAFGLCQKCQFLYNLRDLRWQFQWVAQSLINTNLRVCDTCYDTPSEFLRAVILPPDPPPIIGALPEQYAIDETDFLVTEGGDFIITEDGNNIVDESLPPPPFDPSENFFP